MKKTPPRFLAIAYDIADDRRRRRVFKTLKNFGKPVQYSAFECVLDGDQLSRLRQLLTRQTDDYDDSVAYYQLCDDCARRTVVFCGPTRLIVPRVVLV